MPQAGVNPLGGTVAADAPAAFAAVFGPGGPGAAQQPAFPGAPPPQAAPPGFGPPQGMPGSQPPPPPFGAPPPGAMPGMQPGFGAPPGAPPMQGYGAPPGQPAPYGAPPGYPGMQPGMPMQPGMQPGMPPQAGQPQPGGGMSFGVGGFGPGGLPRISIGTGDFNPNKLWSAVISGQGYENPRKMGAIMIGIAFAFAAINFVLLLLHFYYPYLYVLAGPLWCAGWTMLIFGQPKGANAPMWGRILLAAALVSGALAGIGMIFFPWEAMLTGAAVNAATGR